MIKRMVILMFIFLLSACSPIPAELTPTGTPAPPRPTATGVPPTATLTHTPTPTIVESPNCPDAGHIDYSQPSGPNLHDTYYGSMGESKTVGMALTISGPNVEGAFFYAYESVEMNLKGCLEAGRKFSLRVYDQESNFVTVFHGEFPETDPRISGEGPLQREVIKGSFEGGIDLGNQSVDLVIDHGGAGTVGHEYAIAGATDDAIVDAAAQKLLDATKIDDQETIAGMILYPIQIYIAGILRTVQSQKEFKANYTKIFTKNFKTRLEKAIPKHMAANGEGIMLGPGYIWFQADGKVIAINSEGDL